MKPRRSTGGLVYLIISTLLLLLEFPRFPMVIAIEDDSDYFFNNVTLKNFEHVIKENDNLESLFKDRQFSTYRDLKSFSFREGAKIFLKQSKYASLLEIPLDMATRRDLEDIMVFPRESSSLGVIIIKGEGIL